MAAQGESYCVDMNINTVLLEILHGYRIYTHVNQVEIGVSIEK